ncbi:MAG: 6-bladed beta-propeller [Gemmatimonadetes bacterium]|nr:6-bladed beta-propeller [Gemmatimonadota bacterium]
MRTVRIVLVCAVLVLGVVAGAMFLRSDAAQGAPLAGDGSQLTIPQPEPSDASGRIWRPAPTGRTLVAGSAEHPLLNPFKVQVVSDGRIFVLDFGDRSVKEFSATGALVRTYGIGDGRGPGELLNPTDFFVSDRGEVWILDPAQGRIMIFDHEALPLRTIPVGVPAIRLMGLPDNSYVLMAAGEKLFSRYTPAGDLVHSFGQFVEDQLRQGIALQGDIARIGEKDLIYAPLRAGYIARFSAEGELRYYKETVDRLPYPGVEAMPSGGVRIAPESRGQVATRSVSVLGDEVYLLTPGARVDGQRVSVADVYDGRDGSYRYSFRISEEGTQSIAVTPSDIFMVADTSVTRWHR